MTKTKREAAKLIDYEHKDDDAGLMAKLVFICVMLRASDASGGAAAAPTPPCCYWTIAHPVAADADDIAVHNV